MAALLAACDPCAMRIRLKEFRERLGLTLEGMAEKSGFSVSQLSRWESGTNNIPSERLPRLALNYECRVGEIFDDGAPLQPLGPQLNVIGEVAAGIWREAIEWPQEDWLTFYGRADVTVPLDQRFGLRIVGESMNLLYPHGSIVECVKLLGGAELSNGKRVAVLRQREDGEYETTVKEYVADAEGVAWLWPRSSHPEFQQPWRMDHPEPGITLIEVLGVVVASIRPE